MTTEIELAQKMVSTAEKLLHEVERLRRDIVKLHGRIEPFDGEPPFIDPLPRPIRTMTEALEAIEQTRRQVQGAEYHLGAIRAVADGISKDAISREEIKPYLKN